MVLNVQAARDSDGNVFGLNVHPCNTQILSRGNVIGFVQSISESESRSVGKIFAIGVEGPVGSAVGNYGGGTLQTPVIQIYDTTPLEAFGIEDQGGGVGGLRQLPRIKSLYQQRLPLDIRSIVFTPNSGEELVTTYVNCWITSTSKTIQTSGATVGFSVSWSYEILK